MLLNIAWGQRYLTPVFNNISVTSDIQYGQAQNYLGVQEDLLLDLYEPSNDPLAERPLIVYSHGGGFIDTNQSKSLVHIVAFCDSMARRGYAVASIDYRLDTSISNRAVINGMHDAKAAVRYFRANAAVHRIDTNLIFFGGESAGAINALTTNYVDLPNEVLYPPTLPLSNDVSVEGNSGNPGHSSRTKATLCYCAGTETSTNEALFDTTAMSATDPLLFQIHGTNDQHILIAHALAVSLRADHIGLPYLFHAQYGAVHCPWFFPLPNSWAYLDTLIDLTVPFLYACVQGSMGVDEYVAETELTIFPNPSNGVVSVRWSSTVANGAILKVLDPIGRELRSVRISNVHYSDQLDLRNQGPGLYSISVTSDQGVITERVIIR